LFLFENVGTFGTFLYRLPRMLALFIMKHRRPEFRDFIIDHLLLFIRAIIQKTAHLDLSRLEAIRQWLLSKELIKRLPVLNLE